jgi:glucose/arabinose dehydrogenase
MSRRRHCFAVAVTAVSILSGLSIVALHSAAAPRHLPLDRIKLPAGFAISLYTDQVPGARSLTLGAHGTVFVGTRDRVVYALVDSRNAGHADRVVTVARGLDSPNGVAFHDGALYVAETRRVLRYDAIEQHLDTPPKPVVVKGDLPGEGHHGWRYIGFGPDRRLYVAIGSPCNVCEPKPPHGTITRMQPDGSGFEVFARGIRNSVGFDWHPETRELWFTDNGRDWLGDDSPPDELNHAPRSGLDFGFPYCHGGDIRDPEFGARRPCGDFVAPVVRLGPHVASLGMRFYTGNMFPAEYKNQIFIAEHGSWNRSTPIGYRVTHVRTEPSQPPHYEPFAEGWLDGGSRWGRPVDLLVMPDGALLVSDDHAGAVYRITYRR